MNLEAPQTVMLLLALLSLLISAHKHGESRGKYNMWASLAAIIIQLSILSWGGFFSLD